MKELKHEVSSVVDELTLFDDDLMSRVFDNNIEATELVLRIILRREIKVISAEGQDELKNHEVGGRNITLDVHAIDVDGKEIDIEVQSNAEGANIKRARFHSSMVDSRRLQEGQSFKELKDSYVIFMYKHDKFKKGLPLYHVERYVSETEEMFEDGSHIIYVNGNYKGTDDIGKLISDFHQEKPENMYYDELAQGVKHFKLVKGGHKQMSEKVERFAREYAKEYAKEYAVNEMANCVSNLMKNMKCTLDQALNAMGIQGEEEKQIKEILQK